MEEDFIKWSPELIKAVGLVFGTDVNSISQQSKFHVPLFKALLSISESKSFRGEMTVKKPRKWEEISMGEFEELDPPKTFDGKHPYYGKFMSSKPLFNNAKDILDFKNTNIRIDSKRIKVDDSIVTIPRQCYHIELDLGNSGLVYKTGDHVGVWGANDPSLVDKLGKYLMVENLDALVTLSPNPDNILSATAKEAFPQPSSIRDALTHYLDILATVKQHHFVVNQL